MRDVALIRQASLRASGADIHEVKNLIAAYEEACRLVAAPKAFSRLLSGSSGGRDRLIKLAKKWRVQNDNALRAYVGGTPIRKVVTTPHGPWWYQMKIRGVLRSAGVRVRSVGGLL